MPQLSYSRDGAVAVAGMLADEGLRDVVTKVAYEPVDFGRFVVIDAATGKVRYATDDTRAIIGVTVFIPTLMQRTDGGKPIQAGMEVSILRKGRIWMDAALGVSTPADLETVKMHNDDTNAGTIAKYGKVTGEAASADVIRTLSGRAVFYGKPDAAATLVKVELNLP